MQKNYRKKNINIVFTVFTKSNLSRKYVHINRSKVTWPNVPEFHIFPGIYFNQKKISSGLFDSENNL